MKKALKSLIIMLMVTGVACDGSSELGQEIRTEEEQEKKGDVQFKEYSLEGTSCKWMNLNFDDPYCCPSQQTLFVIDCNEELEAYIEGTDYPAINFSEQTLLLAYGVENYQHAPDSVSLQQVSEQNYIMTVNLRPTIAPAFSEWEVAIVVDKFDEKSKVELDITRKIRL